MRIWEHINKVMETDATTESILNWMKFHKACPVILEDALDINDKKLYRIAYDHCMEREKCESDCYGEFLNRGYKEGNR